MSEEGKIKPGEYGEYTWLDRAGIHKRLELHALLGCPASFALFVITIALVFFTKQPFIVIPVAVGLVFLGSRFRRKIFFNYIRCPKCRFNPTRRKSDGEPREDYHKVLAQLSRYDACPNCGDRGLPSLEGGG